MRETAGGDELGGGVDRHSMQLALVMLSILALVLIARTEPHDVYEIVHPRGDDPARPSHDL